MTSSPGSSEVQHHVHVVDAIVSEHKDIRAFYQRYASSSTALDREKWSNQWRWTVARHSVGEELIVYPALEKHVAGGRALADKDRSQHHVVKQNLSQLEKKHVTDTSFDPLMQETQRLLEQHMHEEEENDLVKLRDAIPRDEGILLGTRFRLTKRLVPTHAHPGAPDKPPFETIVGLLAAPIDKLRDMFEKFPSGEEIKAAKPN